uniref:Uncharacterized protein n=1 Tax=Rhizophora mucronata TaxID=61149 RepID=A0A2P2IZL0_RHIMU
MFGVAFQFLWVHICVQPGFTGVVEGARSCPARCFSYKNSRLQSTYDTNFPGYWSRRREWT